MPYIVSIRDISSTFRTKDNQGNVNYGFAYSIPLKIVKQYIGEN